MNSAFLQPPGSFHPGLLSHHYLYVV
jgi:hypothetical protein